MTDDVIGTGTHQQLITLLTEQGARFRVMEHEAVGKCEAVSEIRGTDLRQGPGLQGEGKRRKETCSGDPRRRPAG